MRVQPAAAYQSLAPFYDRLMAHVDYPLWADYVRALCDRHGRRPAACFDAACGTGRLLAELRTAGLRVAGADGSAAMLAQARRRLRGVPLTCQDLRLLEDGGRWPLVTCLYDSLNYLTEPAELAAALGRLGRLLNEEGLLVFDICTERNSLEHFHDRSEQGRAGPWSWERHSWYERGARLHHNEFLVERRGGGRFVETHLQRIYAVAETEELTAAAGLELLGRYADFSLRPGGEEADRVHFVARRRRNA